MNFGDTILRKSYKAKHWNWTRYRILSYFE